MEEEARISSEWSATDFHNHVMSGLNYYFSKFRIDCEPLLECISRPADLVLFKDKLLETIMKVLENSLNNYSVN